MRGRRLLCVINSLEGGGAERVFVAVVGALAEAFGRERIEVALLDDAPRRYALPAGVREHVLDAGGGGARSVRRLTGLARRVRPAAILSFLTRANCAAIVAARASGARVAVSQRTHTSAKFAPGALSPNRLLIGGLYRHADLVVAVSQAVADDLKRYGVPERKRLVIYNPLDLAAVRAAAQAPAQALDNYFVAVGRLIANKDHATLLRAFARAATVADLAVLGEGPERPKLEALAQTLGVSRRVHFLGFVDNPHAVMARAKAFVSASRCEGFPNALAEAMALGLPCAFTDCDAGPAEMLGRRGDEPVRRLTEARYGLLAPIGDEAELAAAFEALERPDLRARLGAAALRRAEDFSAPVALSRYVEAMDMLLSRATVAPRVREETTHAPV